MPKTLDTQIVQIEFLTFIPVGFTGGYIVDTDGDWIAIHNDPDILPKIKAFERGDTILLTLSATTGQFINASKKL